MSRNGIQSESFMSVFQRQPTITSHVGRKIKKIIVSLIVSLLELIQWEIITVRWLRPVVKYRGHISVIRAYRETPRMIYLTPGGFVPRRGEPPMINVSVCL